MTSIVWAPGDLIIATNQGIDVCFCGVEITDDVPVYLGQVPGKRGIRVHLSGVRTISTMKLDDAYNIAMEVWSKEHKAHGKGGVGPRPIMPGDEVLTPVQAVISDNRDTDYKRVAGRVAGSGSEWDAVWVFVPEPPAGVKHLTIEFTLDGEVTGRSVRVQLD